MKHYPLRIEFPWSSTRSIEELERVFGCAVYFNKEEIAIYLDTAHVEEEVLTSNYDLLRVLVTHAEEKMAGLTKTEGYANLVKQSILKLVKPEFPTIEQVASHLNVSLRTLQRRLKEEGLIYKQIINELRNEMALAYLKKKELSISEIAYLLSYTDNSSFTRAFKNWTGKTPNEYRVGMG
ncbi:MAG: helix-turn-helix transcriptional regulator [Cytophagales bacterium]|nr:helix-turn-helix transcriptional regulator [Cytophagales bacterium]